MFRRIFLAAGFAFAGFAVAAARVHPAPSTRAAPPVLAHLALLGDPHVSKDPACTDYVKHFAQVIDEVNASRVDAVLIAGDLTQEGKLDSFNAFKEMIARFKAPCLVVPGNHDIGNKPYAGRAATVTEARATNFENQIGPCFYQRDLLPNLHIVAIATPLLGSGLDHEKAQWKFLERSLAQPRDGATILFTHYPLFASTPFEPDEYFNINTVERRRLLDLLHQGGISTYLSAHLHRPVSQDWEGVHIVGAPAISFGLPKEKQPEGWTLVTVTADGRATAENHFLPDAGTHPATTNTAR